MANPANIKSLELERCFLNCILKDVGWLDEIGHHVKSDFFAYGPNQKIYAAIKIIYNESKSVDSHILIYRLSLMGLTSIDSLPVEDYVSAISSMSVNTDSKKNYLEELIKFYYGRKAWASLEESKKFIVENLDLSLSDLIKGVEKKCVETVTFSAVAGDDDKIVDLYGEGRSYVDLAVKNKGKSGVFSPFKKFNDIFGSFYFGGLFMFAARSKVGKSTFLACLADHFARTGEGKIKICYCDTEMSPDEVYFRNLSVTSGVDETEIRDGTFSDSSEKVLRVNKGIENLEEYKSLIKHIYVPDSPIDEVESMVKRWYAQNVNEEDIAIVIYDYVKSTSEVGGSGNLQEYQIIGEKTNKLKALAKALPRMLVISSTQLNEQDGVSQSARIKWFCDSLFILQKKTPDEIGEVGKEWGTHLLYPVVTRKLGKKHKDFNSVQVMEGNKTVWKNNYINFNIDNFKIEERGTYDEALEASEIKQLTPRQSASEKTGKAFGKYSK